MHVMKLAVLLGLSVQQQSYNYVTQTIAHEEKNDMLLPVGIPEVKCNLVITSFYLC